MATKAEALCALADIKKKDKYLFIAANVEGIKWEVSSEGVDVFFGLAFCAGRIVHGFSDSEYSEWLILLRSLDEDDQRFILDRPDGFILFCVDYGKPSCSLLSSGTLKRDITKVLYWAIKGCLSQVEEAKREECVKAFLDSAKRFHEKRKEIEFKPTQEIADDSSYEDLILSEDFDGIKRKIEDQPPMLGIIPLDDDGRARSLYNVGNMAGRDHGKDRLAILLYREALKYQPQNSHVYNNLATSYKRMGEYEQAEKYYLQAIAFDPDYLDGYLRLALLKAHQGEKDDAQKYYDQYLKSGGDLKNANKMIEHTEQGADELEEIIKGQNN